MRANPAVPVTSAAQTGPPTGLGREMGMGDGPNSARRGAGSGWASWYFRFILYPEQGCASGRARGVSGCRVGREESRELRSNTG